MSTIVAQGWVWLRLTGIRCSHYFIVTDERPQMPESLCKRYSTAPGIADELKPEVAGHHRDARRDCKACRKALEKRKEATSC